MRVISLGILAVLCGSFSALAQSPTTAAHDQTFTLTITAPELSTLADALGALPYVRVAPFLAKLQSQITAQTKAPDASTPPAAPATSKDSK